jgi:hypothetical protein
VDDETGPRIAGSIGARHESLAVKHRLAMRRFPNPKAESRVSCGSDSEK